MNGQGESKDEKEFVKIEKELWDWMYDHQCELWFVRSGFVLCYSNIRVSGSSIKEVVRKMEEWLIDREKENSESSLDEED